ncbi:23S rRNA (adenine(2030)-N(6))-methyltransferase RlmJ [Legionella sp. D16C41]|uniref:23S rRNA (adenine(2030)-N(6))-methyltransferase RlmJ n=1 Tax=Legionella sp. D16C41 TaxID=3402688 RepID=UPI003AF7E128
MLSYQHGYHAGNFADVIKHLTLCRILNYLTQKDKPLFYLETHAGSGLYDLQAKKAVKTIEFNAGIALIWQQKDNLPTLFDPYMNVVKSLNINNQLRFYPGSPYLAIANLRPEDRAVCTELHPQEFNNLQSIPRLNKRVFFNNIDGLKALRALLPPPERRGLIFIDPSYEIKTEYKTIAESVNLAHRRFATGTYCIWYPILASCQHQQLIEQIKSQNKDVLKIEFYLTQAMDKLGMNSCGLLIINPPFTLAAEMTTALDYLIKIINPNKSSYLIE